MIAWIYKLIIGNFSRCDHKWELISKRDIASSQYNLNNELFSSTEYILQCKKCGDIKSKSI